MKYIIILCLAIAAQASEYCKCSISRHPHIKCYQSQYGSCPDDVFVLNMTEYKLPILNAHNARRNTLAGGRLRGFPSAARMASMRWNPKLADLAKLHIETCSDDHDCHDTERFPYSGQNLAYTSVLGDKTVEKLIKEMIRDWWAEYRDCTMDSNNLAYGGFINHFLAMALEKNNHIGCAAAIFTHWKHGKILSLTCNYARGILTNEAIYTPGQPTSGCLKGNNERFKNLCSQNEEYNHNLNG